MTPRRKRNPLSPKPILDSKSLREALEARGISISEYHLDNFYALLHRLNYPSLSEFVEYHNRDIHKNKLSFLSENDDSNIENQPSLNHHHHQQQQQQHLAISSYKKKNARQLPHRFLDFLADTNHNSLSTLTSSIYSQVTSLDGTTTKLVIQLQDHHFIESVIMRHGSSRVTLCVSSQVGCQMKCNFCATGTMGLSGNLSQGEILEQLVHATHVLRKESSSSSQVENKYQFESIRNIGKICFCFIFFKNYPSHVRISTSSIFYS